MSITVRYADGRLTNEIVGHSARTKPDKIKAVGGFMLDEAVDAGTAQIATEGHIELPAAGDEADDDRGIDAVHLPRGHLQVVRFRRSGRNFDTRTIGTAADEVVTDPRPRTVHDVPRQLNEREEIAGCAMRLRFVPQRMKLHLQYLQYLHPADGPLADDLVVSPMNYGGIRLLTVRHIAAAVV